ncbi:MAG: hypothetical protein AMJ81_08185 [Phycisphaerae bacterium SM23_33]|nr:MAG: hypothetical protein AMJ81_08185 [Phycisphaerae bacterium SM23_33]
MNRRRCLAAGLISVLWWWLPAAAGTFTELPHPDPKPRFDHTKIDRRLKQPQYASQRPLYRFLAFGPDGGSIVAMVIDESGGTGRGVDVLYVDLNADHDLTQPSERFALKKAYQPRKLSDGPLYTCPLTDWGVTLVPRRKLDVPDPKFEYLFSVESGFILVQTTLTDKSWGFPMRVADGGFPWSEDRQKAPVVRFGGDEFTFANEDFARRAGSRGGSVLVDKGKPVKTLRPGDNIYVDGTTPFFLGSSPEIRLGQVHGLWCPWTDRNIEAWVEAGGRRIVKIPFHRSCGGAYWGSILVTAAYPPGRAALAIGMDTRGYLGRIVKRIPFHVDNPLHGKGVEELAVTRRLRREHAGATVIELYQGAALAELGIPEYDGARDVYFGDGRPDKGFGGSCQNVGNDLSYGTELRYRLDLGGELRRTLIKFDLSMLDAAARVKQAVLALHVLGLNSQADRDCRAYALKKRWDEQIVGAMGGLNATNSPVPPGRQRPFPVGGIENWDQPMFAGQADRQAEPIGSLTFEKPGWAALDITAAVQNWVSGRWPNHGLALELVKHVYKYGGRDVWMASSEYAVDPRLRPRLVLALEGPVAARPYRVQQINADLDSAMERARQEKKLVLCHVLSAGSLTSRRFKTHVLNAVPQVRDYIRKHFVEMRIDAGRAEHAELLRTYGVRRFPSSVVISPRPGDAANFVLIEPWDWDALFGVMRSHFEFEQTYTAQLQRVLDRARRTRGRLAPTGEEIGGCGG